MTSPPIPPSASGPHTGGLRTGGPLSGLRVLDAASLYAAPLLASLLADHGADVVKLEPPGGDSYRSTPFWPLVARGKRSLVLDLSDPADRAALHRLVGTVDVVVLNEPATRLARRGLDPNTLLAVNPRLVIAHVSGYGADGPYANRPGNGTLAEAFAGLTHMTGDTDGPPVLPSVPLGDAVMAFAGAFGVLAACYELLADADAGGRIVDVNPVDAMLHVVGPTLTAIGRSAVVAAGSAGSAMSAIAAPPQPPPPSPPPPPGRLGSRLAGSALRNVFATATGDWVAISVSTPRQSRDLAALVGAPEGATGLALENAVRDWLGRLGRGEALERLNAARLPVAPVNNAHDLAADPHVQARRALRTLHATDGRRVTVPAPAPRIHSNHSNLVVPHNESNKSHAGTVPAGDADAKPEPDADADEALPDAGLHTAQVLREWARRECSVIDVDRLSGGAGSS